MELSAKNGMRPDQHEANKKTTKTDIQDLYQSSDIFSGLTRWSVVRSKLCLGTFATMGRFCCIMGCSNRSDGETYVIFYKSLTIIKHQRALTEQTSKRRRDRWILNIRRDAVKNNIVKYSHVCSIHFHQGYKLNNTRISFGSYINDQLETPKADSDLGKISNLTVILAESRGSPVSCHSSLVFENYVSCIIGREKEGGEERKRHQILFGLSNRAKSARYSFWILFLSVSQHICSKTPPVWFSSQPSSKTGAFRAS